MVASAADLGLGPTRAPPVLRNGYQPEPLDSVELLSITRKLIILYGSIPGALPLYR
jgi:hypothetical protein